MATGTAGAHHRDLLDAGAVSAEGAQTGLGRLTAHCSDDAGAGFRAAAGGDLIVDDQLWGSAGAGQARELRVFGHQESVPQGLLHHPLQPLVAQVVGGGTALASS